jgi:ADP-ribose pyrophosphatase
MWVWCRCGRRHYGPYGAAGLVLINDLGQVLLAHRSEFVHFAGTWSFPGGALEEGETPADAALRELHEEIGVPPTVVSVVTTVAGMDHEVWRYTYVLARLNAQWTDVPFAPNWETEAVAWLTPDAFDSVPLHPDLAADLPTLRPALATVIGAPPRPATPAERTTETLLDRQP